METADGSQVIEAIEALRREVARLGERVGALEAGAGAKSRPAAVPAAPGPAPANAPAAERLSEELVLVISAAIAAFLGKKPHIRQIRLAGSTAWSQQGRVTIQASHVRSPGGRS